MQSKKKIKCAGACNEKRRSNMTKEIEEELREQISRQRKWEAMSYAQKNQQLFLNQKELLDKFLACHAISQAQYDKSLGDLRAKMGITETETN